MDFAYSDRVRELQECTRHFMQHQVLPVNNDYLPHCRERAVPARADQ